MASVHLEHIVRPSWRIRCYKTGSYEEKSFIDVVAVVEQVSPGACEISLMKGELDFGIVIELAKELHQELGFESATFGVKAGTKSFISFARFIWSLDGLDWYELDLVRLENRAELSAGAEGSAQPSQPAGTI